MKLFFIFCVMLFSEPGFGQLKDSTYNFSFSSKGTINKTNDKRSFLMGNEVGFSIKQETMRMNNKLSWLYGTQQKNLSNNDVSAYADIDLFKKAHRLYYWGLLTFDESFSLKIKYRVQTGAGVGYSILLDSNDNRIVLSDGLLYESSDLYDPKSGRDIYKTFRNSFRLKYHLTIDSIFSLDGVHFLQNSLSSAEDYNIKSMTKLSIKLNKWLCIEGNINYDKVNRTQRENLYITYGLTINKQWNSP